MCAEEVGVEEVQGAFQNRVELQGRDCCGELRMRWCRLLGGGIGGGLEKRRACVRMEQLCFEVVVGHGRYG